MAIDFTTGIGPTVLQHLQDAPVVWLTTVGTSGTPQPNVVWFYWDGESVIVFSQPSARRLRNIDRNGRVSLNFNTDAEGSFMYVITGDAMIDHSGPRADEVPGYVAKYGAGIENLGMTPASFAADYSVSIRIVPHNLRGF